MTTENTMPETPTPEEGGSPEPVTSEEQELTAGFDMDNANDASGKQARDAANQAKKDQKAGFKEGQAPAEPSEPLKSETSEPVPTPEDKGADDKVQTEFEEQLKGKRADALAIAGSKQFKDWFAKQDAKTQERGNNADLTDALWVLALYDDAVAKGLAQPQGATQPVQPPAQPVQPVQPPGATPAPTIDFSQPATEIVKALGLEALKIKSADGEWTFGEFATEYPDIIPAMVAVAQKFGGGSQADLVNNPAISEMKQQLQLMTYWDAVRDVYPEARQLIRTPEFTEWRKGQPSGIQKLADSWDPGDMVTTIKLYKDDLSRKAAAATKDQLSKNKSKLDGLHQETLRSGVPKKEGAASSAAAKNDLEAGFQEAGEKV